MALKHPSAGKYEASGLYWVMDSKKSSLRKFTAKQQIEILEQWDKDGFATYPRDQEKAYQRLLDGHWLKTWKGSQKPVVRVKENRSKAYVQIVEHNGRSGLIDKSIRELMASHRADEPGILLYEMKLQNAASFALG